MASAISSGPAERPSGRCLGEAVEALAHAGGAFGAGRAGGDGVDANALRAVFGRPGLGERDDRRLGGAVGARAREPEMRRPCVRDIDDCSRGRAAAMRGAIAAVRKKGPRTLVANVASKLSGPDLVRRGKREDPGIVDEDVDVPASRPGRVEAVELIEVRGDEGRAYRPGPQWRQRCPPRARGCVRRTITSAPASASWSADRSADARTYRR